MLSFAQHKGREEKGWEYLVGARRRRRDQGSLSTWPRAAAAQQSFESERETNEEGRGDAADGGNAGYASTAGKKTHGLLVGRFPGFFENLCFFLIFLSLPFNFLFLLISYLFSLLDTING